MLIGPTAVQRPPGGDRGDLGVTRGPRNGKFRAKVGLDPTGVQALAWPRRIVGKEESSRSRRLEES